VVGLAGALLTALGFAIGGGAWGWVVLAVFVITVLSGLVVNVDVHALGRGDLAQCLVPDHVVRRGRAARWDQYHPWNQALAWLIGAAIAIALITVLWLLRDESRRRRLPLPEIPDDLPPVKLSRPIVLFVVIRAMAVSGAVAIAWPSPASAPLKRSSSSSWEWGYRSTSRITPYLRPPSPEQSSSPCPCLAPAT
jgi:hypothetical protein